MGIRQLAGQVEAQGRVHQRRVDVLPQLLGGAVRPRVRRGPREGQRRRAALDQVQRAVQVGALAAGQLPQEVQAAVELPDAALGVVEGLSAPLRARRGPDRGDLGPELAPADGDAVTVAGLEDVEPVAGRRIYPTPRVRSTERRCHRS